MSRAKPESMPKTMIAIPVYNAKKHIERTLKSCLNQSVEAEILIVDNASTDETKSIIERYAKQHASITYIRNEVNIGRVGNWNKALEAFKRSECKYIKYVFSGDEIFEDCIKEIEKVFESNDEIGAIAFPYEFKNLKGKINISRHEEYSNRLFSAKEATEINIAHGGILGAIICNAYSKKAIGDIYFDENYISKVDFDIKALEGCNTYYLDKTLARFHQSARGTFSAADSSHVFLEFSYLESKELQRVGRTGKFNKRELERMEQMVMRNTIIRQSKFMSIDNLVKTLAVTATKQLTSNIYRIAKLKIKYLIRKVKGS